MVQYSTTARDAAITALTDAAGAAPTLEIRTGPPPANCATASSGTLLVSMTLPSTWLTAASGGSRSLAGLWQDPSADATGVAGHYRIFNGATCHQQGVVTVSGGGGDLTMLSTSITAGDPVTVTTATMGIGGA